MPLEKITLDSSVWKDQLFLNWLQSDKCSYIEHICPIIIYLETRLWYDMKGLEKEDFQEELKKLNSKIVLFNENHVEKVIELTKNSKLPFKHHARDFMIESIVLEQGSRLITHNIRHFTNIPEQQIKTPKEFLHLHLNKNNK